MCPNNVEFSEPTLYRLVDLISKMVCEADLNRSNSDINQSNNPNEIVLLLLLLFRNDWKLALLLLYLHIRSHKFSKAVFFIIILRFSSIITSYSLI